MAIYSALLIIAIIAMTTIFLSYAQRNSQSSKLRIVCTTSLIADAVNNICKHQCDVISLMDCGIDPHIYRPRESDINRLATADIIFYNGLHLEGKMSHLLKNMNTYMRTVAVTDALSPHELREAAEFQGCYDPHVWLEVRLWRKIILSITEQLCDLDPSHAQDFRLNCHEYCKILDALENEIRTEINQLPKAKRILVTAHDAFGYFARAYDFKVMSIQGMSTESEPGVYDINTLVDFIVAHDVHAIFIESSISPRSMGAVQQAVQARGKSVAIGTHLYSDALGQKGSDGDSYIGMIKHNVHTIVQALQ